MWSDRDELLKNLGEHAKVLIELHKEDPVKFPSKVVVERLMNQYKINGFVPVEGNNK